MEILDNTAFFATSNEQLYGFAYKSTPTTEPSKHALNDLVNESSFNNKALGITGILLYADSLFFQYLEGTKENIQALYIKILQDQRHHTVTTLMDEPIDNRLFSDWSMKLKLLCDSSIESVPQLYLFNEGHQEYAFHYINNDIAKRIIDFYASQKINNEMAGDVNSSIMPQANLSND